MRRSRRASGRFAQQAALRPITVRLQTSVEPKALETARRTGERLIVPVETVTGLHEHDRRDTGVLSDAEFDRAIGELFARPGDLVFGRETAAAALARFDAAVSGVLAAAPRIEDVLVVSHGTVIALYVAARTGTDGRALWKRLGLPSIVVLDRATGGLERVVEAVA